MTQKNRAGTKAGGLSTQALPPTQLRHYGLAMLLVGVALGASLLLQHFHFRVPAAPLLLFAVAISSWYGGPRPAALAAIVSTISFYWYLVEPVRTPYIYVSEIPYFITFAAFAALISWFATIRRRTDQALREKADLLDLTHDTVFVMDMEGAIKYWNRGAEGLYGWTTEQAVSKVVYALLNTVFPVPREEIVAEVVRTGRWEGELVQTKKDGTPVAVASRWALQRDERGAPVAVMETNNDIAQRQRAEEALRRLNRELRAISNCNQALLRATDDQSLLEEICRIVCDEAGYCVAWVGYAEQDEAKSMRPVAWTGIEEEEVANLGVTWADTERGRGPGGTAIRTGKTCFVKDYTTDPDVALWKENALQHGFRSAIGLPLKDENANPFGSLIIYSAQPNAFTPEEIRLLEELAADLAFGIVTLRSRAARDRAEQGLRQSEAYRMEAERLTHTGSWAVDVPSDKYVYCSEEDLRIWGYDPQGPLPTRETVFRQVLPEDGKRVEESFQKALREKVDTSCEYRIVLPDGTLKHVHVLRHPILNSAGEVVKLVGTSMDITERKQAEEALRRSEVYLAEGQRLSHTGSFAADCDLKPLYWTEEMYRILGLDPQQGLPALDQLLQRVHPGDMGRHLQAWDRAIKQKLDSEVEFRIVLPDGTIKHVQGIGHPVLNDKAEVVEVVGTLIDITERKRAEEALRRSEAYLAEA
ncbi:MAG TPA: PAS domain-containing protein, partial [Terriglobia bacterium]|nr:PAS domain-containing protein [Terriglobia bacterium]